jgi:hypothetical protein
LDENKAYLARLLSEVIMKKGKDQPVQYKLVTRGELADVTDARSTRRDDIRLRGNLQDTRLTVHSCEDVG